MNIVVPRNTLSSVAALPWSTPVWRQHLIDRVDRVSRDHNLIENEVDELVTFRDRAALAYLSEIPALKSIRFRSERENSRITLRLKPLEFPRSPQNDRKA
jgi:hypothetical protein